METVSVGPGVEIHVLIERTQISVDCPCPLPFDARLALGIGTEPGNSLIFFYPWICPEFRKRETRLFTTPDA